MIRYIYSIVVGTAYMYMLT